MTPVWGGVRDPVPVTGVGMVPSMSFPGSDTPLDVSEMRRVDESPMPLLVPSPPISVGRSSRQLGSKSAVGGQPNVKEVDVSIDDLPVFLTVEEDAVVLRTGRTSAYLLCHRWFDSGGETGLPCVQVGRQLRVPRSALQRMAISPGDAA